MQSQKPVTVTVNCAQQRTPLQKTSVDNSEWWAKSVKRNEQAKSGYKYLQKAQDELLQILFQGWLKLLMAAFVQPLKMLLKHHLY